MNNKMKLLKSLGKIYLTLLTLQAIVALPAISSKSTSEPTTTISSSASSKPGNSTSIETSNGDSKVKCKPNTQSCQDGYSCIRFNSDKENNYTCVKDEEAYCESDDYCKTKLGKNFKYCYIPPWMSKGTLKQCFTEQDVGGACRLDIHCVNTLTCKNNRCVSKEYDGLDDESNGNEETNRKDNTIFGINKWIVISALAFPVLIFVLCLWCWFIGRSSSKHMEDEKKAKYESELKKMTLPSNNNNSNRKSAKTDSLALSEASHQRYLDPQKEIEEEVGKRGFRSLFRKSRGEDSLPKNEPSSIDISTTKVGGKAPINTSTASDTQQKMKNLTTNTKKNNAKKSPAIPTPVSPLAGSSRASSIASFPGSNASSTQNKARTGKKKATTPAKKTKKGATSSTGNDASNSTSSKQSSQRGLVNNASNMSSALSGQSSSYFSGVSSLDAQSVLYYQQMYNAAAVQAAAQNQYYAQYMQNPYYAAAAAATANAAYYAQDPNAAAAMYASNYQNQQGYQ
ncbi:hypothetical protein BCR32DRAFT_264435 [Anaeromyces robustus]|uniref:Dickkopf N-terminal cysteine-rich domain-containing protein n=1 Tax=Anaeromyces robustus TaxID=1754192 RepID=A0A1Y1XNK2_9FUNG|nr:hypothetical protein BCR32DRAFT_264435 [Anaeromyces robustus]|eukprot:ORX87245.1 hypothetical protein BCR32DRAFT_264435 [Anaeromyces robustus]